MKLLVFAHVPPPHHGQSYAVKLMLESFGGNRRKAAAAGGGADRFGIECYHVNARYSKTLEDIGEFQRREDFSGCLLLPCRPSGAGFVTAWTIFITSPRPANPWRFTATGW